jgi:hypothetical protein
MDAEGRGHGRTIPRGWVFSPRPPRPQPARGELIMVEWDSRQ